VSYKHAYVSKLLSCVWKPHFAYHTLRVEIVLWECRNQSCACGNHTRVCCNHICACRHHTRKCHNHTHSCQNPTLLLEITLMRVEITRVKKLDPACINHTQRVVITLVSVIQTHTCQNHSRVSENHILSVKSHSVWKSFSACRNLSCACWNYTRAYFYHIRACWNHTVCWNHTRECHIHTHTCKTYSSVRRKHTLLVKSHSASGNLTLCVETKLVRVEISLCM
jgi:hypothetical protein